MGEMKLVLVYKKIGYSNYIWLKYPIKIKNRSSLRETSFSRRPTDFKKCVITKKCFILSIYTTKCFTMQLLVVILNSSAIQKF